MAFSALLLLCLFLLNRSPATVSRAVPDHRLQHEGITIIRPIEITHEFVFPKVTTLVIDGALIIDWDEAMFSRLNGIKYLTLVDGTIPTITFRSTKLLSLSVVQCDLSLFDVWPEKNTILETLQLSRNSIRFIPTNIMYLEKLTSLDLSQNELEYVDLGVLENMTQLKTLDLSVNKIVSIDAPPSLRLQRLKNLAVSFNRLERFDVFPDVFPSLATIRLIGNKWTCRWVDRARKRIIDRRITTFGVDYGCSEHRQGGLCCYGEAMAEDTTEAVQLREGPLVKQIQELVNDLAERPLKTGRDQSVVELLTRNDGGEKDKILVGVKLDDLKVFI